jgi:hypothetical protein
MMYHECAQLILDFWLSLKSPVFAASVHPFAVWEWPQGSYHTDYTPRACIGVMGVMCRPPGGRCELTATLAQEKYIDTFLKNKSEINTFLKMLTM